MHTNLRITVLFTLFILGYWWLVIIKKNSFDQKETSFVQVQELKIGILQCICNFGKNLIAYYGYGGVFFGNIVCYCMVASWFSRLLGKASSFCLIP